MLWCPQKQPQACLINRRSGFLIKPNCCDIHIFIYLFKKNFLYSVAQFFPLGVFDPFCWALTATVPWPLWEPMCGSISLSTLGPPSPFIQPLSNRHSWLFPPSWTPRDVVYLGGSPRMPQMGGWNSRHLFLSVPGARTRRSGSKHGRPCWGPLPVSQTAADFLLCPHLEERATPMGRERRVVPHSQDSGKPDYFLKAPSPNASHPTGGGGFNMNFGECSSAGSSISGCLPTFFKVPLSPSPLTSPGQK